MVKDYEDIFIITGFKFPNLKSDIQIHLYDYGICQCVIDDKGNREVDPEFIKIVNAIYTGIETSPKLKETGFDIKEHDERYGKYEKNEIR